MAVRLKTTWTPSINSKDQETLSEPKPLSAAETSVGLGGGPVQLQHYDHHYRLATTVPYIITSVSLLEVTVDRQTLLHWTVARNSNAALKISWDTKSKLRVICNQFVGHCQRTWPAIMHYILRWLCSLAGVVSQWERVCVLGAIDQWTLLLMKIISVSKQWNSVIVIATYNQLGC